MAEYIEREAVMQKLADHAKRSNNSDFAPVPTWNQAVKIVEDIPAADVVERKKGKWTLWDATWEGADILKCSECGATVYYEEKNFCPNCGSYNGEEDET